MLAPTSFAIRPAVSHDALALRRMAVDGDQRPLAGDVLVGELGGRPAAALSLKDGRSVADASADTGLLLAHLRSQAAGAKAVKRERSLAKRMLAGVKAPQERGKTAEQAA